MYKVFFYKNRNGEEPVLEHLKKLRDSKSKDSRIKLNKINDYIRILSEYGTSVGKPYIDHIDGEIWEIRPIRDRILFVAWKNNSFICYIIL